MYILIQHTGNTMTDVLPNFKVSSWKQGHWAQNRIFKSKKILYLVQGYGKFFFKGVVDHCGLFFSSKVDQMQDIVTGNPAVIKIVVHFNRWIIENVLALFLHPLYDSQQVFLLYTTCTKSSTVILMYENMNVAHMQLQSHRDSWNDHFLLIPVFVPVEFLLPHCFKCEFVLSMFYPSFIQRTEGSEFAAWATAAISWRCS